MTVRRATSCVSNVRDDSRAQDWSTHKSSVLHWTLQYFTASQSVQIDGICLVMDSVHLTHLSGSLTSAILVSGGRVDRKESQVELRKWFVLKLSTNAAGSVLPVSQLPARALLIRAQTFESEVIVLR